MVSALFNVGDQVIVSERFPKPPCHVRTPFYCRGKPGEIERICGAFHNPEELAFGAYGGKTVPLYRVRFKQTDLWPDYAGNPDDTIEIEIFEHWLESGGRAG